MIKIHELNDGRTVYKDSDNILRIEDDNKTTIDTTVYNRFVYPTNGVMSLPRRVINYMRVSSFSKTITKYFFSILFPVLPIDKYSGNFLDVGCSTGNFLMELSNDFNKYGLEINIEAIKIARERGLNIKNSSIEKYSRDAFFDIIYSYHVIEHIDDINDFLKNIRRLLKDDGLFVLYTPNTRSLAYSFFKEEWVGFQDKTHRSMFNKDNIKQVMEKNGLKVKYTSTHCTGSVVGTLYTRLNINTLPIFVIFYLLYFPFSILERVLGKSDSLIIVGEKANND